MSPKSSTHFLRRLLLKWLDWLEKFERKSPRSSKKYWFQVEIHIPPVVVAILSAILLWAVVCWGAQYHLTQLLSTAFLVILSVFLFCLYLTWDFPELARDDDATSLLAVIFFMSVFLIKFFTVFAEDLPWLTPYATPVAIAPLLTALLLHPRLAIVLSFVTALVFGAMNGFSIEIALVGVIGNLTMVAAGSRARTAHHVAKAGLLVGLAQLLSVILFILLTGDIQNVVWTDAVSPFGSGILAAAICLGALPFLESFFSRTSNLYFLELADVNHPLLRKMSLEAPGTYHHSMIVANLAAEAASAIGANSLLCRVGAYFHDIGKLAKPEYFIENQGAYGNPHDQVNPSLSKLVIVSHVKEGVALGKLHKLDQQILDFIPQHHGTSQMEFFYQKALRLEETEDEVGKEDIQEETYRYPGPKPQTRETAIVMLADSVEASSRTVEEPSHQRYKDLVNNIVERKLQDSQLDESPLTLRELHLVSERFIATLSSFTHGRVAYPDNKNASNGKKERPTPPGEAA